MPDRRSQFMLLFDIIDRPGRTLAAVVAYPGWRWLLPTLLAVGVLAASAVFLAPLTSTRLNQMMTEQLARLPSDQVEAAQARLQSFTSPLAVTVASVAGGALLLGVGWLAQATFLYFGSLMAGADVEFRRVLAAMPWLHIPFTVEVALQTAYQLYRNQLIANLGLSYLVSTGEPARDMQNVAYVALAQVTLFRLWHAVLIYLLLRVGLKLGVGASFWMTMIYLGVSLGLQLAFASVSA
jgi:hypothetical protein